MSLTEDEERILPAPSDLHPIGGEPAPWSVIAHDRRVTKGWLALCEKLRGNCIRCYALRHKNYAGVWAYEVGSGDPVYYRLDEARHQVLVYYAGPHPARVPYPPED